MPNNNQIIDFKKLAERCSQPTENFHDVAELFVVKRPEEIRKSSSWNSETRKTETVEVRIPSRDSLYYYRDNNSKILAVAHLDSVISPDRNWTFQKARLGSNAAKYTCLWNAQLDDRLGVYIILDLLPKFLGEGQYDILLTNDEETGQSTAANFVPPQGKEYNWMFQFDRRGVGAVLYSYDDKLWRETTGKHFNIQQGTFSDICKLEGLGCKGINVGTGYHNEHQDLCYMVKEETESQVMRFINFFHENKDVKFPHTKTTYRSYSRGWTGGYDDDFYEKWWDGRSGSKNFTQRELGFHQPSLVTKTVPETKEINEISAGENSTDWDENGVFVGNEITLADLAGAGFSIRSSKDVYTVTASEYQSDDLDIVAFLPGILWYLVTLSFGENHHNDKGFLVHNPINDMKMTVCSQCQRIFKFNEVLWDAESVEPYCYDCVNLRKNGTYETAVPTVTKSVLYDDDAIVRLSEHIVQWVKEGGGIRVGERVTKSFVGVKYSKNGTFKKGEVARRGRAWCDCCNEAEWPDKLIAVEKSATSDEFRICRACYDQIEPFDEQTDSE